ncbi:MAG: efflux RND transporter permease subunit [Verrucomicrobia bacterium]|nr:efflux RND transporter permease subunit [Verrucomicrobiota bacterium]MBU4292032.1 efflux RND transporter permease subunit [Verrucomicrobiota bacterium]MBU4427920.1 efflux RND transporter permease subunit [Verrucomicrobiota bacterium]MCG2678866.1 efflux RND transporter permease subunit [Kiritimatiellia bacterium]
MTLSDLSIHRPVFAWMLMFGLIVFGAISLNRMGISQMPDVDFPVLGVRVSWEGAAPEIMESELVDKIEQLVIAVDGVKEIRSTIQQGQANVELEFELSRDIDAALQEVQGALAELRLPLNVNPPVIQKNTTEGEPVLRIGVSGAQSPRELVDYVETFLLDQLQVIPGVGEVALFGFGQRNLRLWVDTKKLQEYELTILDLQQAIEQEHTELAAGYIENSKEEMNLRTMGEGLTVEQVANIPISHRGGQPIQDATILLKDVSRIEDGLSDVRRLVRISGEPGLVIGISKQRGANEVEVGRRVRARLDELQPSLPKGMKLQVNADFTRAVEQAVKATEHELVIAAMLTALICFLFLGTWSSGFNIILAIPTSIIGTFSILYFAGFTLNTFTLLGLALAIGIVVDDAIMVLENIVRHFEMGKNKVKAAEDGSREIIFAAVATTAAVVAIFLPVAFMSGVIGRFFFQFGVTMTAAVALSLLEAVTLTPMRLSMMMSRRKQVSWLERHSSALFNGLSHAYGWLLPRALRWRWGVLAGALVIFLASLWLGTALRQEFVPSQDMSYIGVSLRAPVGSSLALTDTRVREVESYFKKRPEILRSFTMVSSGGQAHMGLTLVERNQRKKTQAELMNEFRRDLEPIKGLRISFQDMSARGLTARHRSQPVEFNLRGADYAVLESISREIMARLEKTGLVVDLDNNYRTGMPEVRIIPDRQAAAARGVTMEAIGRTVNAAMGGIRQGKFTRDGRRYDIRLRLTPEDRLIADDVNTLAVRNSYGELIPLEDVMRLETVKTLQNISRINRQRSISVTANLAAGASQARALEEAEKIARGILPPGYTFNLEGGAKTFSESFGGLWFAFVLGIVVAYMVLASQFNSFIHPFTVLLALPFSITGALVTLWGANQSLNLYSAIGVILLMGIVKKNSILLVEFMNRKRAEGMPLIEAILTAAPIRLRPILMTSVATMAAAFPIALGIGTGAETRQPMALAIIGGVFVSTLFTLLVVPCAYSLLARFERGRHPLPH